MIGSTVGAQLLESILLNLSWLLRVGLAQMRDYTLRALPLTKEISRIHVFPGRAKKMADQQV
jgi:hypothetical protein